MAAHLLNRAGFGGTPVEIDSILQMGLEKAVESFLKPDDDSDLFPRPALLEPATRFEYHQKERAATSEDEKRKIRREARLIDHGAMLNLRLWWLNRMRYTSAPLVEKATLFWHGHFATSEKKVINSYMMWRQNETLRQYALGKFPDMLKAISRDPAMIR